MNRGGEREGRRGAGGGEWKKRQKKERDKKKKGKRGNNGEGKSEEEEEECVGSAPGLEDDSQLSLSTPVTRNEPRLSH